MKPEFLFLDEVNSTNSYASDLLKSDKPVNGLAVMAGIQTEGRGQRGNVWLTEPFLNLTGSIIIYPELDTENAFYLSIIASLAVHDVLNELTGETHFIKWPNDILAHEKKTAGILIENQLRGTTVSASIIGVGVNVNQVEFAEDLKATSMQIVAAKSFSVDEVFRQIHAKLDFYLYRLGQKDFDFLTKQYHQSLFGLNEFRPFEDTEGSFRGKIVGVEKTGLLLVERSGSIKKYDLKEIKFHY